MKNYNNYKYQNRKDGHKSGNRSIARSEILNIKKLGKKIKDKYWWTSLSSEQKLEIYNNYEVCLFLTNNGDTWYSITKFEVIKIKNDKDFDVWESGIKTKVNNKKLERSLKINSILK